MEVLAFRPLRAASPVLKLVATIGILLALQATVLLAFGPFPKTEPSIISSSAVSFLGQTVPESNLILALIAIVAAAVIWAAYRWTRFGLETKAAFENETSARLIGLSVNRLSMSNTLMASVIAGAIGILAAPVVTLDSQDLPLAVVPALAAALFADFTNFPIACGLGIVLGALQNVLYYASTLSWFPTNGGIAWPGVEQVLILVAIVIALFLRGNKLPERGERVEKRLPIAPRPERLIRPAIVAFVVLGAALIILPFDFCQALVNTIIAGALTLSVIVITGYVGQVSIMQLALAGVSAYLVSHLATGAGIGFPLAPIIAALAATALGLIVGVSALRVRGVQLAVVTLAAAVAIENAWFTTVTLGGGQGGAPVPQPNLFGLDLGNAAGFRGLDGQLPSPILGFIILGVTGAAVPARREPPAQPDRPADAGGPRERAGRGGVRRQRPQHEADRVRDRLVHRRARRRDVRIQLRIGFLDDVRRGLRAGRDRVRVRRRRHDGPRCDLRGPDVDGGAVPVRVPEVVGSLGVLGASVRRHRRRHQPRARPRGRSGHDVPQPHTTTAAVAAGETPRDLLHLVEMVVARLPKPQLGSARGTESAAGPGPGSTEAQDLHVPPKALRVTNLTVRFGGVTAVDDVSLEIAPGEIVGLIGPNGAGKSSLIDALTGFSHPASGTIVLGDDDLTKLPPHRRVHAGLVRSWQSVDLFDDVTVGENMAVGSGMSRWHELLEVLGRENQTMPAAASSAIARFGLGSDLDLLPSQLSFSQRRMVTTARAVALNPSMLLLDEPAGGFSDVRRRELANAIAPLARERGMGLLVVDHDMPFVMGLCDRVVVLNFGRKIADGTPDEVRANPEVVRAYLHGSAEEETAQEVDLAATARRRHTVPRADTEVMLAAKDMAVGYFEHPVVRGVELEVRPGEVIALLGANRAGKTTTLLGLAGAIQPLEGEVYWMGEKLSKRVPLHKRASQGLGFLTDERAVFMQLSVSENLRVDRNCDAAHVLRLFPELADHMSRRAGLLSGGQQQMLGLGRALARHPKVLLIDEMSLGLAPGIVTRLMEVVRNAADEDGIGVVLVEQHVQEALKIADRVCVVAGGRMTLSGPVEDVIDRVEDAFLADVLGTTTA